MRELVGRPDLGVVKGSPLGVVFLTKECKGLEKETEEAVGKLIEQKEVQVLIEVLYSRTLPAYSSKVVHRLLRENKEVLKQELRSQRDFDLIEKAWSVGLISKEEKQELMVSLLRVADVGRVVVLLDKEYITSSLWPPYLDKLREVVSTLDLYRLDLLLDKVVRGSLSRVVKEHREDIKTVLVLEMVERYVKGEEYVEIEDLRRFDRLCEEKELRLAYERLVDVFVKNCCAEASTSSLLDVLSDESFDHKTKQKAVIGLIKLMEDLRYDPVDVDKRLGQLESSPYLNKVVKAHEQYRHACLERIVKENYYQYGDVPHLMTAVVLNEAWDEQAKKIALDCAKQMVSEGKYEEAKVEELFSQHSDEPHIQELKEHYDHVRDL